VQTALNAATVVVVGRATMIFAPPVPAAEIASPTVMSLSFAIVFAGAAAVAAVLFAAEVEAADGAVGELECAGVDVACVVVVPAAAAGVWALEQAVSATADAPNTPAVSTLRRLKLGVLGRSCSFIPALGSIGIRASFPRGDAVRRLAFAWVSSLIPAR
jgi:hypothetical protein